jgi:demethylmenaquinone methyltransferase/2-methoxy-6-polyprenyl-1,4-benzoquinol methylase
MDPTEKHEYVHQVFTNIATGYDKMNDIESLCLHRAWKRALIAEATATHPQDVLDVATGTGDIVLALRDALPASNITGLDFCEPMLDVARRRIAAMEETVHSDGPSDSKRDLGPELICGDAMEMPFADSTFDVVTISFGLRNMPSYEKVLKEIVRVLRPGCKFICLEASYPTNAFIKPFFKLYFKHIMPAMGSVFAHHKAEYQWLNDSTEAFLSKPELAALMEKIGLKDVHYKSFLFGAAAIHIGIKA